MVDPMGCLFEQHTTHGRYMGNKDDPKYKATAIQSLSLILCANMKA
jgi:hypothetical protein